MRLRLDVQAGVSLNRRASRPSAGGFNEMCPTKPREHVMTSLLKEISSLIDECFETDPPQLPNKLKVPDADKITDIQMDSTGKGIQKWLGEIKTLGFSSEAVLIRVLQIKFPRVAELLTLLGVIDFVFKDPPPNPGQGLVDDLQFNWSKIDQLLTKPDQFALGMLLERVNNLQDIKALQALVLMLVVAPKELLVLEYDHQGFLRLPLGNQVPTSLQDLIDLVNSPIGFPLPPGTISSFPDFKNAATSNPGSLGSVIIQGPNLFPQQRKLNGFGIELKIRTGNPPAYDLDNGWSLNIQPDPPLSNETSFQVFIGDHGLDASRGNQGNLAIRIRKQLTSGQDMILLGKEGETCLKLRSFEVCFRFLKSNPPGPLFDVTAKLEKIHFEVKADFLKFLELGPKLPTSLKFESDVVAGFVQGKGLTGQNGQGDTPSLGIQFASPLNLKIGGGKFGVNVDQVITRLETKVNPREKSMDYRALFRYSARGEFGPVSVMFDGAGVWIGSWLENNKVEFADVLLPQAIGVLIDAGPVRGGGFLQYKPPNDFAGALQLKILGVSVFAYGVYTKPRDQDASFVALIGLRLPFPGIQLGFGFAVSGFGGLVGVNRQADTDLLRDRLIAGTSGDVLFNDDPVKNAPRLLGDLTSFFPPEPGVFIVGPTLQINWLSILKLDLGIFIELPGPRKIFIVGSARLQIGPDDFSLVYLRMDFIGGVDFTKSLIFFDAALVNSHILTIFRISGGVALRLGYGSNKSFLLSIGGFHPQFRPLGIELPQVPRVGVSMSVADIVWMKLQMYLALTSNTVQFGARIEAGVNLGPISANGWFGFDALIYLDPFKFIAEIDAGFDVRVFGESLCGVRLQGRLSGPGPLVLNARASLKILFVRISESVTIELDDTPGEPEKTISPNVVLNQVAEELAKPDNLRSEGEDASVFFKPNLEAEKLFSPVGALVWEQKRSPLKIQIQKFEGTRLPSPMSLNLSIPSLTNTIDERDSFGMGSYSDVSEAEKLNVPGFSDQVSGVRLSMDSYQRGNKEDEAITINLVRRPYKYPAMKAIAMSVSPSLGSVLGERNGGAKLDPGVPKVAILPEAWNVHEASGKKSSDQTLNPVEAFLGARQVNGIAIAATSQPVSLSGVFQ